MKMGAESLLLDTGGSPRHDSVRSDAAYDREGSQPPCTRSSAQAFISAFSRGPGGQSEVSTTHHRFLAGRVDRNLRAIATKRATSAPRNSAMARWFCARPREEVFNSGSP